MDYYLDQKTLRKKYSEEPQSFKRIFFFRICGTGMGAAACLLKEAGFDVSGADTVFAPPMSTYLESTGIPIGHLDSIDEVELRKYDLIVVGNVVPRNSEEAYMIERCGVPFCSFPSALGALALENKKVIGIAGTHGKTTTTFFMTQLFENLGEIPGYFIGGVIPDRVSSTLGGSKYFFIESDEYDSAYFEKISKFRLYGIDRLVLTSLEFDHADIFESVEDIKQEFRAVLPKLSCEIIFDESYDSARELLNEYPLLKRVSYGGAGNPKILEQSPLGTQFEILIEGALRRFETNIVGYHNILNLTACLLTAYIEGFSIDALRKAVKNLGMIKRRQEKRGYFQGSLIYDDFAHHPRSVRYTIEAIKLRHPDKKIYVILEPSSATARSALFQTEFAESLQVADLVIMAKPEKRTSIKDIGDLNCYTIADYLNQKGIDASVAKNLDELEEKIKLNSSSQNLWLVLSNGTCLGLWKSHFAKGLSEE